MLRHFSFWLTVWLGFSLAADAPPGWRTNACVVLVGGTQLASIADAGYLETALTVRGPGAHARFRDLSWEGDTVFAQPRPVNFPPLTQFLERLQPTLVLLQFGQMESLRGRDALGEFVEAYDRLLRSVQANDRSLVLLTPLPFFAAGPIDASVAASRNAVLADYVKAIQELGRRRSVPVLDVFSAFSTQAAGGRPVSVDGLQLTDWGQQQAALAIAASWGVDRPPNWKELETVRQAVIAKNALWFRYWRPTNWAFLGGDRTDQPSSRDHRDRNVRWFPVEIEEYGPLIQTAEAQINQLAQEALR